MVAITIDSKQFKEIIKKYSGISEEKLSDWIFNKCKFYNKLNQEDLEKYGFEEGKKFEWNDKIKDSILLIDLDYKPLPEQEEIDKLIYEKKGEKLEYYTDEELIEKEFSPPEWIIKNQIPKGEIGIIAGKRGERKTFFTLYQAICCSAGINCIEDEVNKQFKVIFVSEEDGILSLLPRIKSLKKGLGIEKQKLNIIFFTLNNLKLDIENEKTKEFYRILNNFQPDLIIIDTLQRCVSFDVDVDNKAISEFFTGKIKPLQKVFGGTWLFIHHLRKGLGGQKQGEDLMDEIRGGSEIVNFPRFVLICQVPKQSNNLMVLTPVKMSYAELTEPKVISFNNSDEDKTLTVTYEGLPKDVLKTEISCGKAIMEYLFKEGIIEFQTKDIQEDSENKIGYKHSMITSGLKYLVERGDLQKIKRGHYKVGGSNEQNKQNKL